MPTQVKWGPVVRTDAGGLDVGSALVLEGVSEPVSADLRFKARSIAIDSIDMRESACGRPG